MPVEKTVTPFTAITDQTAAATAPAMNQFEKTVETLKQAATSALNVEKAQAQLKEGMDRAMKTAEQLMSFGQGNVEAVIKSSQILSTGLKDLSKSVAGTAQANFEESVSTLKAFSSVKSIKEAIELQTSYARGLMEKALAESGKFTEHTMKLAEEAGGPITARVNVAVETFSSHA